MEMLTFSHVEKHFGEKKVLQDASFSVPEHTIFGFIGKNGAGKTTAMKLILGLLACDSGEILVNGFPVRYGNTRTNRFIGYLPDVPEFYPYMTPTEYLHFCGEVAGMPAKECKARAKELLRLVGLEKERGRIKGFSRGMKQRLGIAQALFGRPKLLICDEPTSALDPAGRKELLDILAAAKEQSAVLFSTHILSDVEHICDKVAFLHEGRVAWHGSLEKIRRLRKSTSMEIEMERPEDAKTLLAAFPYLQQKGRTHLLQEGTGMASGLSMQCGWQKGNAHLLLEDTARLPEILHFLAGQELPIQRMERKEPTLEDLFLEVIAK